VIGLSVRSLDEYGSYRPAGVDHFTRMAGAAAFTALDQGLGLMLVPLREGAGAAEGPLWVDGYIMEDPHANDPVLTRMLEAGVPVVTIGWDPARKSRTSWVSTSDRDAGYQLLDLMAEHGAERICFVCGTERNSWNNEAERAYRAWCRENGRPIQLLRLPEDDGEDGGARLGKDLLHDASARPDAIYCQTGRHATGVARTARELGLRIPEDLMVAAGSDTERARSFDPPITVIDLQPETLGREAVELLVDLIGGSRSRSRSRSRTIAARLLERGSTGR
jgi:DNA-binding LacI/PurR family transcriptional regulator